ncbi:hypothetical protein [Serinicoccus marinus]|uniref:hypothetical protein n=1 Tax=Serinicoccus marinus TaxID=247333 RepID=UPI0003B42474|nr:hypothetical protein [Serinicoccus marinus]
MDDYWTQVLAGLTVLLVVYVLREARSLWRFWQDGAGQRADEALEKARTEPNTHIARMVERSADQTSHMMVFVASVTGTIYAAILPGLLAEVSAYVLSTIAVLAVLATFIDQRSIAKLSRLIATAENMKEKDGGSA